jgi:predicted nucleic-acid-binding Zn-ribbon protein
MKKGKCPKCQSKEIYIRSDSGLRTRFDTYGVSTNAGGRIIQLFTFMCSACGYIELYSDDKTDDRKEYSRLEMLQKDNDWKKLGDNTPPME